MVLGRNVDAGEKWTRHSGFRTEDTSKARSGPEQVQLLSSCLASLLSVSCRKLELSWSILAGISSLLFSYGHDDCDTPALAQAEVVAGAAL